MRNHEFVLLIAITGFACNRVAADPRLVSEVACWKMGEVSPQERRLNSYLDQLADIAVDEDRMMLFVYRHAWSAGLFKPIGIFGYNLADRRMKTATHIPTRSDLSGKRMRGAHGGSVFDLARKRVFVGERLDNVNVVLELQLSQDQPRIAARNAGMVSRPNTGDGRLLLWTGIDQYEHKAVLYLDLQNASLTDPLELPVIEGVEWVVFGGVGDYLFAYNHLERRTFYLLKRLGGQIVVKEKRNMEGRFYLSSDNLVREFERCLLMQFIEQKRDNKPLGAQLYELPAMRPAGVLSQDLVGRFVVVPGGRHIALIPFKPGSELVLYDLIAGRVVARQEIPCPGVEDPRGSWDLRCSQAGRYLSAFGSHSIHVFEQQLASTTSRPEQNLP